MTSLYIDTSATLTVGLLDDDLNWISLKITQEKKSSSTIHKIIFDELANINLEIKNIDQVFSPAGPGSYTGMRVTEGINQVFELNKIKVYTFYHYQVPKLVGHESGLWFSNAFKGEIFIYSWCDQEQSREVLKLEDFNMKIRVNNAKVPLFYATKLDSMESMDKCLNSIEMISSNPRTLFTKVKDLNLREEIYYYRPLSQEFNISK